MKEMFRRAGRTFLQAAVGYIAANLVCVISTNTDNYDYLKNALIGLGVSAIAAGLAAMMNLPKSEPSNNYTGD